MIKSFKDKRTKTLFLRDYTSRFPVTLARRAAKKLSMLHYALDLKDLKLILMKKKLPPIHPGEILFEEFLEPMGISQYRLAKDVGVPPRRINEIVLGKRGISADTALRLARYFGMSTGFWMNAQNHYDLEVQKDLLEDRLEKEVKVLQRV